MSLGAGIFARLDGATSAGSRVYPLALPQGAARPAITWQLVGGEGPLVTHADAHDGTATRPRYERARVQFDCWADTWLGADRLADELLRLVHGSRGAWGAVPVGAAFLETDLDERDPDLGTYRRIVDVMVQFIAAG